MMQMRDWISGAVGLLIFILGLLPLLHLMGKGPAWWAFSTFPASLFPFIVAIGGFYLIINSVIEITNSNIVGWFSFIVAAIITVTGVLKVLGMAGKITGFFALGWLSPVVYYVIFAILGLFLMIATFAMEL